MKEKENSLKRLMRRLMITAEDVKEWRVKHMTAYSKILKETDSNQFETTKRIVKSIIDQREATRTDTGLNDLFSNQRESRPKQNRHDSSTPKKPGKGGEKK